MKQENLLVFLDFNKLEMTKGRQTVGRVGRIGWMRLARCCKVIKLAGRWGAGCGFIPALIGKLQAAGWWSVDFWKHNTLIGRECEVGRCRLVKGWRRRRLRTACWGTNGLVQPDDWPCPGHVTAPAKLIGARWSAVTWCWKRTSWLTQRVVRRGMVVALQRVSFLLI